MENESAVKLPYVISLICFLIQEWQQPAEIWTDCVPNIKPYQHPQCVKHILQKAVLVFFKMSDTKFAIRKEEYNRKINGEILSCVELKRRLSSRNHEAEYAPQLHCSNTVNINWQEIFISVVTPHTSLSKMRYCLLNNMLTPTPFVFRMVLNQVAEDIVFIFYNWWVFSLSNSWVHSPKCPSLEAWVSFLRGLVWRL